MQACLHSAVSTSFQPILLDNIGNPLANRVDIGRRMATELDREDRRVNNAHVASPIDFEACIQHPAHLSGQHRRGSNGVVIRGICSISHCHLRI